MSWGFSIIAKSKEAATKALVQKRDESHGHLPQDVVDLIALRINMLTEAPSWIKNPVIKLETTGHFDLVMGGNMKFEINWSNLAE